MSTGEAHIDVFWLPLGVGGRLVGWNGRIYERLSAFRQHRPRCDLYHSALEVVDGNGRYVVEMAPVWGDRTPGRGVVLEGPVGLRLLGRFRAFRYEVRRWPDGLLTDRADAVGGPVRVSEDAKTAALLLGLVSEVPALVWGRDEQGCGDMWNSNSLVSWLLVRSGHDLSDVPLPPGGRAPGWQAGALLAARQMSLQRQS